MSAKTFIVTIGKDIEVGATDLLSLVTKGATTVEKAGPSVLSGFGVLAAAVDQALVDTATAASNPATLVLNFGSDVADFKAVWSDMLAWLANFGVKPKA
jgi:hypothetical protein